MILNLLTLQYLLSMETFFNATCKKCCQKHIFGNILRAMLKMFLQHLINVPPKHFWGRFLNIPLVEVG